MSAETMDRLMQISRCMDEIAKCVADQKTNKELGGAILGEMDWRDELHYRLYV